MREPPSGLPRSDGPVDGLAYWREIARRLSRSYGRPRLRNRRKVLDELVFILLSAKTEEYNYVRTYRALRRRFRSWARVRRANPDQIAEVIEQGGLARKKASQISRLLSEASPDELELLQTADDSAVEAYLESLPGIGRKSAKCVMLYSLDRPVLPVDAHVWRVASRLLGLDQRTSADDPRHDQLEASVPAEDRYVVHVGLVLHGRRVCLPRDPKCSTCILSDLCVVGRRVTHPAV